jgi:ATP-dependent exoDNAse (exonuclease V) beta subunit
MKFNYQELSASSVDGMRLYATPDRNYYPSITTVLGKTQPPEKAAALEGWRNAIGHEEAQRQTEAAASNGTGVHLLIERYLKKEELVQGDEFTEKMMQGFNSLKLKLNKITEVWGQEVPLFSNLLRVAGRCDCIGVYKGKPCIIDFKTSRRIKNKDEIEDYYLQLTAYSIMHNEMFGTDIVDGVVLMTSGEGFPQEFCVNLLEYVDPLVKRVDKFYEQLEATM